MALLPTFEAYQGTKQKLQELDTISELQNYIKTLDRTPGRGFAFEPGKAEPVSPSELLVHLTTDREAAVAICQSQKLFGKSAWYLSDTEHHESEEGPFAFGWHCERYNMDCLRLQDLTDYGRWGVLFTSPKALEIYHVKDGEDQIVLEGSPIVPLGFVRIHLGTSGVRVYDLLSVRGIPRLVNVEFEDVRAAIGH